MSNEFAERAGVRGRQPTQPDFGPAERMETRRGCCRNERLPVWRVEGHGRVAGECEPRHVSKLSMHGVAAVACEKARDLALQLYQF